MNIFDFKLYVFDLDGVIIDSERLHWEAYKKAIGNQCEYFKYALTFETYCKINHSINDDESFESILKDEYKQVYEKKREYFYSNLDKLQLIPGFEEFFTKLIIDNKIVCLVTDSSRETLELITKKYKILDKFHYVVTRDDVVKRKPSNEGYLKVLKKYNKIDNCDIVGFEDSYKGIAAMNQVIFNTILINNDAYVYYNSINEQINTQPISNYENIGSYCIQKQQL